MQTNEARDVIKELKSIAESLQETNQHLSAIEGLIATQ